MFAAVRDAQAHEVDLLRAAVSGGADADALMAAPRLQALARAVQAARAGDAELMREEYASYVWERERHEVVHDLDEDGGQDGSSVPGRPSGEVHGRSPVGDGRLHDVTGLDAAAVRALLIEQPLTTVGAPNEAALTELLGRPGQWLADLPEPPRHMTPDELIAFAHDLAERHPDRVGLTVVGHSEQGEPIEMLSVGEGGRNVLAYGYPHPNEPIGSTGLTMLAQALAEGDERLDDLDARFHMVLCADPDAARLNADWVGGDLTLDRFVRGSYRPRTMNQEIDFAFPMPEYTSGDGEVTLRHDPGYAHPAPDGTIDGKGAIPPPREESVALARAMTHVRPDLVVSLHNFHSSGGYSFLKDDVDRETYDDLLAVSIAAGIPAQVGEKVDTGKRVRRDRADVLREPGLEGLVRDIKKMKGYAPGQTWLGHASSAQCLEALCPDAQFLIPEAPHFTHPDFGDRSPLGERAVVSESVEARQNDRKWRVWRQDLVDHAGTRKTVIVRQTPVAEDEPLRDGAPVEVDVNAGMLGSMSIERNRVAIAASDKVWRRLAKKADRIEHPYETTRREGNPMMIGDSMMRHFKIEDSYGRPATRAQAADLRYRSAIQSAATIGGMRKWAAAQAARFPDDPDYRQAVADLDAIIDHQLADVPDVMRSPIPQRAAIASQLGRAFALLRGSDGPR